MTLCTNVSVGYRAAKLLAVYVAGRSKRLPTTRPAATPERRCSFKHQKKFDASTVEPRGLSCHPAFTRAREYPTTPNSLRIALAPSIAICLTCRPVPIVGAIRGAKIKSRFRLLIFQLPHFGAAGSSATNKVQYHSRCLMRKAHSSRNLSSRSLLDRCDSDMHRQRQAAPPFAQKI
jgi:hypothetical protein